MKLLFELSWLWESIAIIALVITVCEVCALLSCKAIIIAFISALATCLAIVLLSQTPSLLNLNLLFI